LIRSINHREPETQRYVVREIGRARIKSAVPALSRALEDINVFSRTYETRKEIINALESIGTPEAEKALRNFAHHTIRLGRKTRELRNRAIAVADSLARKQGVSAP
jgi:HEAT repeat protein